MNEDIRVCNKLSEVRKSKGFTQQEFSKLTNLSQQYISSIERGVAVPSLERAILMAEALEVPYSELFFKCND